MGKTGCSNGFDVLQHMRFAFRKWLPHLRCHDSSLGYLDAIGYMSAVFYGVVVPCSLAYLYTRQHLALLPGKTTMAWAVEDGEVLEVRLMEVKSSSKDRHFLVLPAFMVFDPLAFLVIF